jgi:dynein heavy chain
MGEKELSAIKKEIDDYKEKLKENPSKIEALKEMLNIVSDIKNSSMRMEFRIADVVEKFRTLKMYNQEVNP